MASSEVAVLVDNKSHGSTRLFVAVASLLNVFTLLVVLALWLEALHLRGSPHPNIPVGMDKKRTASKGCRFGIECRKHVAHVKRQE